MTEVVAALIWQEDRFLICQRPAHKARGLLWEFVGGKVEPGESLREALIRECKEELDILVSPEEIFLQVDHIYPDLHVHLTLFQTKIEKGQPKALEHNDLRWIIPSEIKKYSFCPADVEILKKIQEVYSRA
ncbi:MAG: (deoxy)nucleoside triphosphate pyrophosphohydrolase [Oscillospiraceae bacterium]|nr:(deoxy)nucleoside triphosphate pyrophosphohydrolase [Oscillospiraceae bacterium]